MNIVIHYKSWTETDKKKLEQVKTFKELGNLVLEIVHRLPGKVQMVSGPISTGGVGTIEGNKLIFERVIEILATEPAANIFSQMPFEDKMVELYLDWHAKNPAEKYCRPILDEFYEPLFSSGKVSDLHFIHGWELSTGATWEHDNCDRWNIKRHYLPQEISVRALNGSPAI